MEVVWEVVWVVVWEVGRTHNTIEDLEEGWLGEDQSMTETRANAPDVITLRGRIVGMWECGKSSRNIAHMTGVSVRTVNIWIHRWQEEGSLKTKPRNGRPKVTTLDGVARILDAIHERPKTNSVQVAADLLLPCHPRTIRRRLKENKINCNVTVKKDKLSQEHREVRLGFALQYLAVDPGL
ncbi:hypothetical protein Pcinc_031687 [Petrolisthes cinctipes]|uniref:Transposase Tc1-like domain-containing protein n=1 Tax=Petrolisthes cinctipes TaxID=88211 RepID=A0AAE1EW38_PETCI|nr:hypothetical protein Pcinc_031687 [Petrolisthes cinctipes]